MLTADHAAEALLATIVANLTTINANQDLVPTGYSLRTDPTPAGSNDTSQYLFLKVGDRGKLEDGLTVLCIGDNDSLEERMTQRLAERMHTVTIAVYLKAERDPEKSRKAIRGAVDGISTLLADSAHDTISLPSDGSSPVGVWEGCHITDRHYGATGDSGGTITRVATITWNGRSIAQE